MLAAEMFDLVLATSTTSTLVPLMVDSGASQHIIDRADLLINVRKAAKPMTFQTVGSQQTSDRIGDVTGFLSSGGPVIFKDVVNLPGAGVNLLSEELLRERGWVKVIGNDDSAHLQHKDDPAMRMPLIKRGRTRWLLLRVDLPSSSPAEASVLAPAQKVKDHPLSS
ncbi:hypothetical protein OC842_007003, partial [Tilletia horrida]